MIRYTRISWTFPALSTLSLSLTLALAPACGGDDGQDDEASETGTDTTTDDTTTDDTTTDDTTDDTTTDETTTDETTDETTTDETTDETTTDETTTDETTDTEGGLSFETDVYPIIMANCSCHVGGAPATLAMPNAATAYSNLVDVASSEQPDLDRITPGDPDNSYLYQKVTGTQEGISAQNAQMPKTAGQAMSANPLSAEDLATINDWIAGGALP